MGRPILSPGKKLTGGKFRPVTPGLFILKKTKFFSGLKIPVPRVPPITTNIVSVFQEQSKNTQIQVDILQFSQILTSYHYQINSIYVKINCLELLEGRK